MRYFPDDSGRAGDRTWDSDRRNGAAIATETTDVALSAQTVGITVKNLWLINTPVKQLLS